VSFWQHTRKQLVTGRGRDEYINSKHSARILTNGGNCLNAWLAFALLALGVSSGGGASVCSELLSFSGCATDHGGAGSGMKQISMMRVKPASIKEYPYAVCT
jgi:hypothetical protein